LISFAALAAQAEELFGLVGRFTLPQQAPALEGARTVSG